MNSDPQNNGNDGDSGNDPVAPAITPAVPVAPAVTVAPALAAVTPTGVDEDADRVDLDASGKPAQSAEPANVEPTLGEDDANKALVESVYQRIRDCDADIADINAQIAELESHRRQIETEKDALQQQLKQLAPPPTQAQATQAYLRQQQINREQRAQMAIAMAQGAAAVRAPIDAARAGRPGHGSRAVQYPLTSPVKSD